MTKILLDKAVLEKVIDEKENQMGQITRDFANRMLQDCAKGKHPPLTVWEAEQLARAWLKLEAQAVEPDPVGEVSGDDWSTGLLYMDLEPGTLLYTHPVPTAKPLSAEEARKLCEVTGAVHTEPNGLLVFYPQQYRDQLTAARIAGLRIGEAAHGIKEQA